MFNHSLLTRILGLSLCSLIIISSTALSQKMDRELFPDEPIGNTSCKTLSNLPDITESYLVVRVPVKEKMHSIRPVDLTDWSFSLDAPMLSSLRFADLNNDGVFEIICTTYGPPPNPYDAGQIAVFDVNGSPFPGWPVITSSPIPATAAIGDVDGDDHLEIVVGDWSYMYVYSHDGFLLSGWPIANGISYSPALEDVDGDGDLEIIYPSGNSLYIRHGDGTLLDGWPVFAPETVGSPAIGDINDDGEKEIIAGTLSGPTNPDPYEVYVWNEDGSILSGFPVATSGVVKSTPAIGDVDNDGLLEIVVAAYDVSNDDFLYCWDNAGDLKPGWPVQAQYCRLSSPALGDADGDGDLEIFIGGLRTSPDWVEILYAYHHDGQPLENWPVELPHDGGSGNINSSPVIAEIDGELSTPEIFVKTHDYIFGLNADGTYLDDFPYYLSDEDHSGTYSPSPAIGDLDNDGDADYLFASSNGTVVFVDGSGDYDRDLSFWPMYKQNQYSTSLYEMVTSGCTYIPGDCNNDGNPIALDDVIAMIGMYRGDVAHPYECDCSPHGADFAPTADPNGNCIPDELSDVVQEIGAYRGDVEASGCEDCPGSLRLAPGDGDQPSAIPSLKSRVKSGSNRM